MTESRPEGGQNRHPPQKDKREPTFTDFHADGPEEDEDLFDDFFFDFD